MTSRAALSLPPSYNAITDNQDAYLPALKLRPLAKKYGRYWSFHSIPTTVALPENRFAKSLDAFTDHTTEQSFTDLLAEYRDNGCPRPSGYADVFHEIYQSPRVPWSVNALLGPCLAGGWQQAVRTGVQKGTYRKYDMRSAYLWAATLGMPDTRTYTRSLLPSIARDGVFRVKLQQSTDGAPFPFNQARECIATPLEIETYNLKIESVVDGVIWKRNVSGEPIIDAIRKVSTWKQAGRMYWGRWGQLQKLACTARGKTWHLPNYALNIPWAHTIISRVKMRLWEFSKNAAHVYVDSVITPDVLPTGSELGDWRLEKVYPDGVYIRGPGQYGSVGELKLERMAGYAKDSPLRYTSVPEEIAAQKRSLGETINGNGTRSAENVWLF